MSVCCRGWWLALACIARVADSDTGTSRTLTVERSAGVARAFTVEVAATDRARAHGLMGRTVLATGTGMWFDFLSPTSVTMWMKDTAVALDIVFIDAAGQVVAIAAQTTPNSPALIRALRPVRYVLEIGAGEAARTGVAVGDRMTLNAGPRVAP